jgi:hydroxyacylglutathione hydrolase
MQFVLEQIRTGGDRNFSYIVGDRNAKEAVIIDPSYDPGKVIARCDAQKLRVSRIINTHGHHDHINGNEEAVSLCGAPVLAYAHATFPCDVRVSDGESIFVGEFKIRFLFTPGHADDHLVLLVETHKVALTADLIFVGKVGGTKSDDAARVEWDSIQKVLCETRDEYLVLPGHDYGCRPASTMLLEKQTNPFLIAKSVDEFLEVKRTWSELKSSQGLL